MGLRWGLFRWRLRRRLWYGKSADSPLLYSCRTTLLERTMETPPPPSCPCPLLWGSFAPGFFFICSFNTCGVESVLIKIHSVVLPDPGRGRYTVPDEDTQGGVAVWQTADGGEQRGGDESRGCCGGGGGGVEQVAGGRWGGRHRGEWGVGWEE